MKTKFFLLLLLSVLINGCANLIDTPSVESVTKVENATVNDSTETNNNGIKHLSLEAYRILNPSGIDFSNTYVLLKRNTSIKFYDVIDPIVYNDGTDSYIMFVHKKEEGDYEAIEMNFKNLTLEPCDIGN